MNEPQTVMKENIKLTASTKHNDHHDLVCHVHVLEYMNPWALMIGVSVRSVLIYMQTTQEGLSTEMREWLNGKKIRQPAFSIEATNLDDVMKRFIMDEETPMQRDLILWILSRSELILDKYPRLIFGGESQIHGNYQKSPQRNSSNVMEEIITPNINSSSKSSSASGKVTKKERPLSAPATGRGRSTLNSFSSSTMSKATYSTNINKLKNEEKTLRDELLGESVALQALQTKKDVMMRKYPLCRQIGLMTISE